MKKKNELEDWIEIININNDNLKREKIFNVINY